MATAIALAVSLLVALLVADIVADVHGRWYGRRVHVERCRAVAVLAHGSDWQAMQAEASANVQRAIRSLPAPAFWTPWRVWRYTRDIAAWQCVRDWAREEEIAESKRFLDGVLDRLVRRCAELNRELEQERLRCLRS